MTSNLGNDSAEVIFGYQQKELNVFYTTCEVLVSVLAVLGNALVIFVFRKERRLRRRTNYYIVSLATADLLVGLLGIPFAILSSVGLPSNNLHLCLFTVSLLIVLCTISIFCLVAVSVDRYWAILHPMGYSRNVSTKTALVIISICWFAGCLVGFLPLMGWHKAAPGDGSCFFLAVMDYNYLVFLYFGTIITPAVLLMAFYAHIYSVVLKQLRQIISVNPENGTTTRGFSGGTMIRLLGVQQSHEMRATQNLAIIVLFFMICWIPLYTINFIIAIDDGVLVDPTFMLFCIILSHLNSAGNPLLYAYHLRDFRAALKNFFCDLFHIKYIDEFTRRRSNYTQYMLQSRKQHSMSYSDQNFLEKGHSRKLSAIVKNSTLVATAPAGDITRDIWNIPEDSGRDSASSRDSLKSEHSYAQDKTIMIRPATPFRPRIFNDMNQAYIDANLEDEVFNDDASFKHENDDEMETCLNAKFFKNSIIVQNKTKQHISNSSPQLSKGVFLIEHESKKTRESTSCQNNLSVYADNSTKINVSPFKAVRKIFRKKVNRSLSDGGTNYTFSEPIDNNSVVQHSCGS